MRVHSVVGKCQAVLFVTRRAGEEFLEDCIVPKFKKQTSVMVWGAVSGTGHKSELIFWDRKRKYHLS